VLLDAWIGKCQGLDLDADGRWAASGAISFELLRDLLDTPYFKTQGPKSTGRELFNLAWLEQRLRNHPHVAAADVQATLLELTAKSIADALLSAQPQTREVLVCGGGAQNSALMSASGRASA
jgi:anhydro-N-acetylmuramic acid kinase